VKRHISISPKSLGQDQFAVAGKPQAVLLTVMLKNEFAPASQELDAGIRAGSFEPVRGVTSVLGKAPVKNQSRLQAGL
jgi:hypothetical protein